MAVQRNAGEDDFSIVAGAAVIILVLWMLSGMLV